MNLRKIGRVRGFFARASFDQVEPHVQRHGRTCSGHPRLAWSNKEDVDARDKRGHDEGGATQSDRNVLLESFCEDTPSPALARLRLRHSPRSTRACLRKERECQLAFAMHP